MFLDKHFILKTPKLLIIWQLLTPMYRFRIKSQLLMCCWLMHDCPCRQSLCWRSLIFPILSRDFHVWRCVRVNPESFLPTIETCFNCFRTRSSEAKKIRRRPQNPRNSKFTQIMSTPPPLAKMARVPEGEKKEPPRCHLAIQYCTVD